MLFKTITKDDFKSLVEGLFKTCEVVAPKKVGANAKGKTLHQFLPVKSFEEIDLGYETTEYSPKTYFLPFQENLSTYRFEESDWSQEIRYRAEPRALLGLHACDINALLKLDKVLARDVYPSPYYIARRENTLIIGLDHEPCEGGFCHSLGTDTVSHGFDLFLTDLGSRYFVAINTDKGFELVTPFNPKEVTEQETEAYLQKRREISKSFKTHVDMQNVPNLLDLEFNSPIWAKWGDKCLSCGSCAMVCPTCYCYGVGERVSMDLSQGAKVKKLHSCNLLDFALVAGGHNFRPNRQTRLKYRYYHQHRGFVESYDEPKCVGCNRCGRVCLAGINPPEVIRDLQMEEKV